MNLNPRELATVRAALRLAQIIRKLEQVAPTPETARFESMTEFKATGLKPLSDGEIFSLFERLNCSASASPDQAHPDLSQAGACGHT